MRHFLLRHPARIATLALFAITLPGVAAALLKIDSAKSNVSAVFKQMNVPVEARFKTVNARIDFNNSKPEASRANVDIDIGSFDLGDADINKEVLKKEWFNAAVFPQASFVSATMKPIAGGKLEVSGKLTLKGKSVDVSFPLTIRQESGNQVFEGALPIRRLAFNIGEGEWKDTGMVADEVIVKFHIVAGR